MKNKSSLLVLVAFVLLALSSTNLKADTYNWNYSGSGITANGTFDVNGTLLTDVGGFSGVNGYAITGITGTRNGVAIDGLVAGGPGASPVGGFIIDNILTDTLGLDWNGFMFNVGANAYNVASNQSPTGGGYTEYGALSAGDSYTGVANAVEFNVTPSSVPDASSTLILLGVGLIGLAGLNSRKKNTDSTPQAMGLGC